MWVAIKAVAPEGDAMIGTIAQEWSPHRMRCARSIAAKADGESVMGRPSLSGKLSL
jgi:hypothetical protein